MHVGQSAQLSAPPVAASQSLVTLGLLGIVTDTLCWTWSITMIGTVCLCLTYGSTAPAR